jgi:hypothetical protein
MGAVLSLESTLRKIDCPQPPGPSATPRGGDFFGKTISVSQTINPTLEAPYVARGYHNNGGIPAATFSITAGASVPLYQPTPEVLTYGGVVPSVLLSSWPCTDQVLTPTVWGSGAGARVFFKVLTCS